MSQGAAKTGSRVPAGFTLIEVLVVVAIIALLVAILMPALARVRAQARSTVCLTHLKEVGNAVMIYAGEYKGWIPRGGSVTGEPHWVTLLPRQLGDRREYKHVNLAPVDRMEVFHCPERQLTLPQPFLDYVVNTVKADLPETVHWDAASVDIEQRGPSRLERWKFPSRVIYVGDAAWESGTYASGANMTGNLANVRENYYLVKAGSRAVTDNGCLDEMDVFAPKYMQPDRRRRAGTRTHLKRFANWVYADGHAANLVYREQDPCNVWLDRYGLPGFRCEESIFQKTP